MGCRFAGAPDLHRYWRLCLDGAASFGPVPPDRWDAAHFTSENPREADKSYAPKGAFIDDIRSFPALALKVPPRRVEVMDPQQRFALEVAIEALDDAGPGVNSLAARTGVFMGVTATEYRTLLSARAVAAMMATGQLGHAPEDATSIARAIENIVLPRPLSAPGMLGNMVAATIAQELDLKGPAYTVDAACASALVAVYDAVAQLRAGTVDAAVAGGVYLCITPDHHIVFSRIGAMSKQGLCLPFDARADGFVQGDGAGAIVLRRLEDAERDGDRIYAVIHGVATNNDGRGDGPMAPLEEGQAACIDEAWKDADSDPTRLGYVETHGTGTQVGDPTEFRGLLDTVGKTSTRVALGSSKANVGHTMSAAGIAGLIRAALAVHHGCIPPMANFVSTRDDVPLDSSVFHIPTSPEPWRDSGRLAAVSSFGFGGTNVHAVIGAAPESTARALPAQYELVLMSAPDVDSLRELAGRTADALELDPKASVAGVVRAWATRRKQPARVGIIARDPQELVRSLRQVASEESAKNCQLAVAEETPRVAFLYPGQGAQRTGMISSLLERFPVLEQVLRELEDELAEELELPLRHLLYPERREPPVQDEVAQRQLTATQNCQPVLLSVGVALTRLLEVVGVRPHVVTGHSLGEFTAAAAGGVLAPAEAAKFVARRGRAMAELPGDHGAMCAVMADAETASQLLVDGAVVANFNHPRQVVVSGSSDAVDAVLANAERGGVKAIRLDVSHAFHSPVLASLDSASLVDALDVSESTVQVASGIADHPYADAEEAREVFRAHATSPVRFTRALEQCADSGANLYLQVGAGGPLTAFARGGAPKGHLGVVSLAGTDDTDGGYSLLEALARLWTLGVPVDASAIAANVPLASVPPTVLPRETYWGVKDEPQAALDVSDSVPVRRPTSIPPAKSAVSEAPKPGDDVVRSNVVAAIATASAYPEASIRMDMTLVDDLGFDSLMVADLVEDLTERVEGLAGVELELFINQPTVQEVVDYVRANVGGRAVAQDDDAPLGKYRPAWVAAPLPSGSAPPPSGAKILLTGTDAPLSEELARRLSADGRETWVKDILAAAGNGPVSLLVLGARPGDDPEEAVRGFMSVLDKQGKLGATPDVLLAVSADDVAAEALSGALRAVAREWPTAACKSVSFADDIPTERRAALLLDEWLSVERTPDVRYEQTSRYVRGLEPIGASPTDLGDQEGEIVLVTGGTRGIGFRIARKMFARGAQVLLLGRSEPSEQTRAFVDQSEGRAQIVLADVGDFDELRGALVGHGPITTLVHAAGVLADGPVGSVDPELGRLARRVKALGWENSVRASGPSLKRAVAIGSWAGRFGSRHQAHYSSANAWLSALVERTDTCRAVVAELGPWTDSEMVSTIPAAVQAAMRSEGVSFVGNEAGLDAVFDALETERGAIVFGRDLPKQSRITHETLHVSLDTHPYLIDHSIDGVPVLPLAAAADLLAHGARAEAPFSLEDLRLFRSIAVEGPVELTSHVRGEKAELRLGSTLAYQARIRALGPSFQDPGPTTGGAAPTLSLREFYDHVTFHGPRLQGIQSIEAVGDTFVRGRVRGVRASDWMPETKRRDWAVDPLVLDSAMQLSGYVAWTRHGRAGTPVSIGRYVQLEPFGEEELVAEVRFGDAEGDRFSGDIIIRSLDGRVLAHAENVVAELRRTDDATVDAKPEWTDPKLWPEIQDLQARLSMADAAGIQNPYFAVHEGTAKNVSVVGGRELVNYSSYNYIGLSGDPRILAEVTEAVERYGTSVSASRVASGERPYHRRLEEELAQAQGAEQALVFTAGHATNVTTIGHLFGSEDLVIHDELIHDSILQGIKLSGAARRGFRHDDPEHLASQLADLRGHYQKVLVAIEGVYSMDGDIPDVPAYVRLKKKYACMLMIDEAHSFGVVGETGRGVGEHFGLNGRDVDIWMGTLSKSLASCGGWVAGGAPLINYLRYTAPGFVYSAGLTPANGQAAVSALEYMLAEPERVARLQENALRFRSALSSLGIDTGPARGESGVIPAITGNSMHALMLSQRLLDLGVNVQPIMYPAVADDAARLRFFISSLHTDEQLDETAKQVAETLSRIRREFPA